MAELCNRLNPDSPIPDNDIAWMDQILSESNTDLTFEELTEEGHRMAGVALPEVRDRRGAL